MAEAYRFNYKESSADVIAETVFIISSDEIQQTQQGKQNLSQLIFLNSLYSEI